MTKNLRAPGAIHAVVNGVGDRVDGTPDPVDPDNYEDPAYVIVYPWWGRPPEDQGFRQM